METNQKANHTVINSFALDIPSDLPLSLHQHIYTLSFLSCPCWIQDSLTLLDNGSVLILNQCKGLLALYQAGYDCVGYYQTRLDRFCRSLAHSQLAAVVDDCSLARVEPEYKGFSFHTSSTVKRNFLQLFTPRPNSENLQE